jgi:hypothetical protein
MLKSIVKLALVASALVIAIQANDVQAAVSTPATATAIATYAVPGHLATPDPSLRPKPLRLET